MKKLCFALFILSSTCLFSQTQLDTTEYFPLQMGDHWEYRFDSFEGTQYIFDTVIGDSLMNNGKSYKVVKESYSDWPWDNYYYFYRNEGNYTLRYMGDSILCPDREYIAFNYTSLDSVIWPICFPQGYAAYKSCLSTFNEHNYDINLNVQTKLFVYVSVANLDTIWSPVSTEIVYISKNVGISSFWGDESGYFRIRGAILNGHQYGEIVGIKNERIDNSESIGLKLDVYPNPFNNSTRISFTLPRPSQVTFKIYNIIGEEVWRFNQGEYTSGDHHIYFNSSNLGSGLYILNLKTESQNLSKKIIVLK